MKIILSRKGFDSGYGGYPSLVLPDGELISFPIPTGRSVNKKLDVLYKDLKFSDSQSYLDLMRELGYKFTEDSACHLDPDLYREIIPRPEGWRPVFGQVGAAQSHLNNHKVGVGDVFLFFGWFKETEIKNGKLALKKECSDKHLIYGYFQVGEKYILPPKHPLYQEIIPEWVYYHSHTTNAIRQLKYNTIYIAAPTLSWDKCLPGAGILKYHPNLVLTKAGHTRTVWDLPEIFKKVDISYHTKDSWKENYFQSASRGQEFVIDCTEEIGEWVKRLIAQGN